MIVLQNVSKSYKDILLYKDVNAVFEAGRKIMIKGFNGSGKSVLLKLVTGYARPDSGTVSVDGIVIGKDRDYIPNAGVIINAPEFLGELTGLENLLSLAEIRKRADEKSIRAIAARLSLKDELEKKYHTYSMGMRQKMRLIQALMDEPAYLILDEPFDALDHKSIRAVMEILSDYMTAERTLLFTNHIESINDFADEVYEIDDHSLSRIR